MLALLATAGGCKPYDPPPDQGGTFDPCCSGLGSCLPEALIDIAQASRLTPDVCRESLLCVPDALTKSFAAFDSCLSLGFAEGRCVPHCLPEIAAQADRLRQDGCREHELCAPCFDPLDGTPSGTCEIGDDPGPRGAAAVFDTCCEQRGRCVPAEVLSDSQRDQVAAMDCVQGGVQGDDMRCVPSEFAADPELVPQTCTMRTTGAEGRCLSVCLPEVDTRKDQLARDGCAESQRCVPCFDPIDGGATGACTRGADPGPAQPPVIFAACCGELGRCVPQDLVPAADRARLGPDTCGAAGELCAPLELVQDPDFHPASCTVSAFGAEGRCLPACLPEARERAAQLAADGCADGRVCVPCFDPLDGTATGACALGADPGPARPPTIFESCCGELGRCVPSSLVAEDDRPQLSQASCRDEAMLCTPLALAQDPELAPEPCVTSDYSAEGRCLLDCLPEVEARAAQLSRDGCAEAHSCVPCFDPFTGDPTAACTIGGDLGPQAPAVTFASCCGGLARCVPRALIESDSQEQLGRNECEEVDALCAPSAFANDPQYVPESCTVSSLSAEGRCLPACLPLVAERGDELARDGCPERHACVPCFDPRSGEATGACTIGGDPGPSEAPATFAPCCGGRGRCVPPTFVPDVQRASVGPETCTEGLCIPEAMVADSQFVPKTCQDSRTGAEGRCLLACIDAVQAQGDRLEVADCESDERCVPCYDPITEAPTEACSLTEGDPGPQEPPIVFEPCCQQLGLCIPDALTPNDEVVLPQLTCPAQELCAPRVLVEDAAAELVPCTTLLANEGVCVPTCLIDAAEQAVLVQDVCDQGHLCSPCELLGIPTGVCE